MAMIYGREADPDKVRADEAALREAMQRFVEQHHFVSRERFAREAQPHTPSVDVAKPTADQESKRETAAAA